MVIPVGLYLSVPFCKAKCSFCNFASNAFGTQKMGIYVERLCEEIAGARKAAERLGAGLSPEADSIYFGGGTPSLLGPKLLLRIFSAVRDQFKVATDAEVTVECAPGQISDETLEELLRQGVNRISLGVQSFVDREARAVGRLHTGASCHEEIARLRSAGVENIGIDLIAGLPHQTEASWKNTLDQTLTSGVDHVSVYMLEVDDGSRLGQEALAGGHRYGAGDLPSEDESAAWYELACERLNAGGIRQYEISNFARDGYKSRHNQKYWCRLPYLGFGLDAHSMLLTEDAAVRFQNTDDLDCYMVRQLLQGEPLAVLSDKTSKIEPEFIRREAALEESLFLGLRLVDGVNLEQLTKKFGHELVASIRPGIEEACEAGLLDWTGNFVRLTSQGRMASNEVFSRLLIPAIA
ncbi:MAG TPA: radical SAM family heme chaperone HemW [Edaphobacter sp.]|nr:radical SAM family heme chaperone HemW [Edaphobacter sp.]